MGKMIFFGFGTFLLILIVIYIVISMSSPGTAVTINSALANLTKAVSPP